MDELAEQNEPLNSSVESIATAMRELGRDIHLEVLASVARSRKSVRDIADEIELSLSDVSKSLRQLQQYGFVEYRRDKNRHIYRLTPRVAVREEGQRCIVLTVQAQDGSTLTITQGIGVVPEDQRT